MKNDVFVERIAYALKKQKSTQRRLAGMTGIPPQMISDYVNGRYFPRQDNLRRIALALKCSEEWLTGVEGNDPSHHPFTGRKKGERNIYEIAEQIKFLLEVDPIYIEKYFTLLEITTTLNYIGLEKLTGFANDLALSGRYKLTENDMDQIKLTKAQQID